MGPLGLWRAVLRRSRADVTVVAATWLLLVSAIALLAGGVMYADTVALAGLRRAVLAAPGPARSVVLDTSARAGQFGSVDAAVRGRVASAVEPVGAEIDAVIRVNGLVPRGTAPDAIGRLTELASFEGLQGHAALLDGRWPRAHATPIEATASEGAARALGLSVGARVQLVGRGGDPIAADLVIAGIWRPNRGDEGYWLGSTLDLDGTEALAGYVTRGPFVVDASDLLGVAGDHSVVVEWRGALDVAHLTAEGVEPVRSGLVTLPARLATVLPPGQVVQVRTSLPDILGSAGRSVEVGRSGVLLVTLQFGVLAGYAVLLVAGILVARRREEVALLRARGATRGHLGALAFGEALLVAVPAAAIAPFLAAAVIRALDAVGPLASSGLVRDAAPDLPSFAVAALGGIGCVVALTVPALARGPSPTQIRASSGRESTRTVGTRLGFDLALVVLAAIAIWQVRFYGGSFTRDVHGTLGLDPLLVAAPGIGLLAGGVAGTRFFPRIAEAAERRLARRRGLVPALGARHLSRRPLRSTRSALLLMLAAALAAFAAIYGSTWTRSQEDQAAYESAADIRVTEAYHTDLPAWALGGAYRAVPGVTRAEPLARRSLEVGRSFRDGQLLAVDTDAAGALLTPADGSGGVDAKVLSGLAAGRPHPAAVALPASADRLALTLDVDLRGVDASRAAADPAGVDVAVVLETVDGLVRIGAGTATPSGSGQRLEVPLSVSAGTDTFGLSGPVRLEAVELKVSPPDGVTASGTIALRGVEARPSQATAGSAAGAAWVPLALDPGATGWGWAIQTPGDIYAYDPGSTPGRVSFGRGGADGPPVVGESTGPGTTYRLWAKVAPAPAMAAAVSDGLLERAGAAIGDTIQATTLGDPIGLRATAAAAEFPSLDPGRPFAIVDRLTYQFDRMARTGVVDAPEEWWLAADASSAPAAAATIRGAPYSASSVVARVELVSDRTADPIPLGLIGALALGSLAAVTIAGMGFVVAAADAASERLGEFAILRALGLSSRSLTSWLALESAVLLGFSLVSGTLLGVFLAWLVVPVASLTPNGAAAVPAPVVVIPPWSFVPLFALGGILLVLSAAAAGRRVPGVGLGTLIRGEDV